MSRANAKCIVCGQTFTPDSPHQDACSVACRQKRSNEQKRAWDKNHPRSARPKHPLPEIACPQCGTQFRPSRRDQRYCSHECRELAYRLSLAPTPQQLAMAQAKHAVDATMDAQRLQDWVNDGRRWTRSRYADVLEAAGLPGNVVPAALALGIPTSTLRMRLYRGSDPRMPLKRSIRRGRLADVELKACVGELKGKVLVDLSPAQMQRMVEELFQDIEPAAPNAEVLEV